MAFFIIAVILIICGIIVYVFFEETISSIPFVLAFVALLLGLFADWGGYEKAIVSKEYKLIPLVEDTNIYLIQSDDETKMVKYKVQSEHDKKIQNSVIKKVKSSVDVEYIGKDLKPVLREYVCKPKKSIWNGICLVDKQYSVLFIQEAYILK